MLFLLLLFLPLLALKCPDPCLEHWISDYYCDSVCMSPGCNFDSYLESSDQKAMLEASDCYSSCLFYCPEELLGNGECDPICNQWRCGWDAGDCGYCAPDCYEDMLENEQCDDSCNFEDCEFDVGTCGDCWPNCYYHMLENDTCDKACNVSECNFDNKLCGCSETCSAEDTGKCQIQCLDIYCNFDINCDCGENCNSALTRYIPVVYYIKLYDLTYSQEDIDSCNVLTGCQADKKTIDGICLNEDCYAENCIDTLFTGCLKQDDCEQNCRRCSNNDYACLECNPYMVNSFGLCHGACYQRFVMLKLCFYDPPCTAENIFRLCIYEIDDNDYTTENEPEIYVVDPNYIVEEGIDTNVNYLFEGLNYAWKEYTTIKLVGDTHVVVDGTIADPERYEAMHMVIESDSMTTVKLMSPQIQFPTTFLSLTLRNIVFDGSQALNNNCNSQTCMYCPFYSYDQYAYYDDRGQLISDPSLYNIQQCSDLTTSVLLSGNFNLTIENCRFTNIKFNPSAIIDIRNNNLSIKDTSFYNLIASSVIMFEGKDYNLSLEGGSVSLINNGFEYFDGMEQSPFLKIESSNWAFIKNVMFDKNAVMCDIEFVCDNLIEIKDSFKTEIENCEFDTNIVTNSLISIDLSSFQLGQISTDDQGTCIECKDYNIVFFNNTFTNSVVLRSALSIEFASYTPNINIYRNSFYNLVGQSSAISITKSHLPSTTDIQGGEYFYTLNGQKQSVILDPKSFQLSHNSFNNTVFDSVLYLSQLPNVLIYNETLSIPTSHKHPNSILSLYSQDPHTYLSNSIDKFQQVLYGSFVKSFRLTNFKFRNIHIEDLKCTEDYCLIDSQQLLGDVTVRSFSVWSLESSFMRLTSSSEASLNITDIDIRNVTATETSMTLSDFRNIRISNLNFQDVMCQEFGALFIENSVQTNIQDLQMTNCSSSRGSGGGITIKISSTIAENSLNIEESSFESCSAFSNAGALYLQGDNGNDFPLTFTIQSSTFANNFARRSGSTLFVSSSVYLSESSRIRNCTFDRNYVQIRGNLMFEQTQGSVSITSSLFRDNTSLTKGSSIYYSTLIASTLSLDSCSFSENEGESVVFVESYQNKNTLNTNNCYFRNNQGTSLHLTLSFWNDSGSTFASNQNNVGGSGFVLENSSQAQCVRTSFSDNEASDGGSGEVLSYSSFSGVSCSFLNNRASSKGGALFLEQDSCLSLEDCFLMGNTASTGSAVYISSSPNKISKIAGSTIKDNNSTKESAVFVERSSIEIVYSEVSGNKGSKGSGGAVLIDSRGEIRSSTFKDQQSTEGNGGGLSCTDCSGLNIDHSTFQNLTAIEGGAVYIKTLAKSTELIFNISNSNFDDNSAMNGGALFIENVDMSIENTIFLRNEAIEPVFSTEIEYITTGQGGGLYMDCETICSFNLSENVFKSNFATYNGGAIAWKQSQPEISSIDFQNNSALYGENIASFPLTVMQVDREGNIYHQRRLTSSMQDSFASGQTITDLFLAVVDHYDQVVTTANTHTVSILPGTNTTISGVAKVITSQGIATFDNLVVSAPPGSAVNISVEAGFDNSISFEAEMRKCNPGEVTIGIECFLCLPGTYSIDPDEAECRACDDNAICYGGHDMVPLEKHWRSSSNSHKVWNCPIEEACLGGEKDENDEISHTGRCREGYTGNLCQACESNYSQKFSKECAECPGLGMNIFLLVLAFVIFLIVLLILVKITMKSALETKSLLSVYIKILLNYFQLIALIGTFEFSWPFALEWMFLVSSHAGNASAQIISFDCLIHDYYTKLVLSSMLPVALGVLSTVLYLILSLVKKSWSYMKEELFVSLIVLLFLIQPMVVNKMFSSMNCLEIQGEHWIAERLDVVCWDDDHVFHVLTISVPSIIIWGIGLPALCLMYLYKKRNMLDDLDIRKKFGFLFNGFVNDAFFWEFVILYRKIIVICCLVFFKQMSINTQAIVVVMILCISLILHEKYHPYRNGKLNDTEELSIIVAIFTAVCGMLYLTEEIGIVTKWLLFGIIVTANLYFLLQWLKNSSPKIIKILKKILCFRMNKYGRIYSYNKDRHSLSIMPSAPERPSVPNRFDHLADVFMQSVRATNLRGIQYLRRKRSEISDDSFQ